MSSSEEWRDVAGMKLQVSSMGRVKRNGEIVRTSNGRVGAGSRGVSVSIGHLVLNTFVGPCPDGMECCHFDDNRKNNALSNLRWDTHSGNMQDRSRNGRGNHAKGEDHGNARFNKPRVVLARLLNKLWPNVWTPTVLSGAMNVSRATVSQVLTRKTWRDVP